MGKARYDISSYDTVDSRLQKFWDDHEHGSVTTELLSDPNTSDNVVFKACVYFDTSHENKSFYGTIPNGIGHAHGIKNRPGFVDASAHLENAETSAIGRALASCGYKAKIDSPRPSREEMMKVQATEDRPIGGGVISPTDGSFARRGPAPAYSGEDEGETFDGPHTRYMKGAALVELAKKHGFSGTNVKAIKDDVEQTYKVKIKGTAPDGGTMPVDVANAIEHFVVAAEKEEVPF